MKSQKLVLKKIEISVLSKFQMQAINGGVSGSYPGNSTAGDCGKPTPAGSSVDAGCTDSYKNEGCLSYPSPASCRNC